MSLSSFESEELNDFTIITGKNGTGKTQLIQLINQINTGRKPPSVESFQIIPNVNKIQVEGLTNNVLKELNHQNWIEQLKNIISEYNSLRPFAKKFTDICVTYNTWPNLQTSEKFLKSIENSMEVSELNKLIKNVILERNPKSHLHDTYEQNYLTLIQYLNYSSNINSLKIAKKISNFLGKDFDKLTESDFHNVPISDEDLSKPQLFDSALNKILYNYCKRRDQNARLFFEKKEYNKINNSIPDHEYIEKFRPPWEVLNSILARHDFDFKFDSIEREQFSQDVRIQFILRNNQGIEVNPASLSSGERVIFGLLVKLFQNEYYNSNLSFPNLIVFDEPDAHLHPELSGLLIDVLRKTFVIDLGIKVIVSTHSPSTVALSPDDSIFEIKNYPKTELKKIDKDRALDILTGHLPTLSIDYKNHKQIFVESPTDVEYYQTIFNKIYNEERLPYKLYFISNSAGKGNSNEVIKIVQKIRESGNKTSFGIIDWDLNNKRNEYVYVHGENSRYSIENFLFDPLYVSVLLMEMEAHNIFEELDIERTYNQYSIGNESNEFLQSVADWFFNSYYKFFNHNEKDKSDFIKIEYYNKKNINIPKWFAHFKGHDFELRIKKVFPCLEGKFTSDGDLKRKLSTIIGKCFPLTPKDSIDLIKNIIRH